MAPCRRHAIRRGNGNVKKIANAELRLGQRLVVVDSLLSCAGDSNLTHLKMIVAIIWEHNGKVKVSAFFASIRINVAHQRRQLVQRRILPGVNLQFVSWHISVHVLGHRVMAARRAEHS